MKQESIDEETRSHGIAEQCWLGPICLLFWVLVIMGVVHGCGHGAECTVAWDKQAEATSYRVWRGIEVIATVNDACAELTLDGSCTLTVTACNETGESGHSQPLHLVAIDVEESIDLKTWKVVRTVFRAKAAQAFYRNHIRP